MTSGPCVIMKEVHMSPHGGAMCHMDLVELDKDPWGKRVPCVKQCHRNVLCHTSCHVSYHVEVREFTNESDVVPMEDEYPWGNIIGS
jgi:hypothetical protein